MHLLQYVLHPAYTLTSTEQLHKFVSTMQPDVLFSSGPHLKSPQFRCH